MSSAIPPMMSSYEVDSDEDAEQRLGEESPVQIIPAATATEQVVESGSCNRYDDVLSSLGLDGKLKHAHKLPPERIISSSDVFCNRDLKQEAITAIGFDMVRIRFSLRYISTRHVHFSFRRFIFRITPLCNTNNLHLMNWHSMGPKRSL